MASDSGNPFLLGLVLQLVGLMPFVIEVAALLALITQDYTDFVLILLVMLLVNGFIGFHEKWKAQIAVDALRSGTEAQKDERCGRIDRQAVAMTKAMRPAGVTQKSVPFVTQVGSYTLLSLCRSSVQAPRLSPSASPPSTVPAMPDPSCSHCGKPVAKRQLRSCGGCFAVFYCGKR
jgi:hypothetical protein